MEARYVKMGALKRSYFKLMIENFRWKVRNQVLKIQINIRLIFLGLMTFTIKIKLILNF